MDLVSSCLVAWTLLLLALQVLRVLEVLVVELSSWAVASADLCEAAVQGVYRDAPFLAAILVVMFSQDSSAMDAI